MARVWVNPHRDSRGRNVRGHWRSVGKGKRSSGPRLVDGSGGVRATSKAKSSTPRTATTGRASTRPTSRPATTSAPVLAKGSPVTVDGMRGTIVGQHPSGDFIVSHEYRPGFPTRVLRHKVRAR